MRMRSVPRGNPDTGGAALLQICLPALAVTSRVILERLVRVLDGRCPDGAGDAVQIVLGEMLNNIVEHGYRDDRLGAVVVRVERQGTAILLTTLDWGRAYSAGALPTGPAPEPEALAEGGYGWFLIRTLARDISYVRRNGCNRLSLSVPS